MDRLVIRQLRVKGRDQDGALPGHDAFAAVHHERSDGRTHPPNAGRPDENHLEGPEPLPEVGLFFGLEALLLPAVRVPLGREVDEPE